MTRLSDIKRWYARARPLTGNGEVLAAVDADALVDDVGWLLARVETLQRLTSAARCPDCGAEILGYHACEASHG